MKKEKNTKLIVILTTLLFLALLYFCANIFHLLEFRNVQAVSSLDSIQVLKVLENENPVNIEEVIKENRNIYMREEMVYEEQDLEYTTQYIDNENLPSGTIHVAQIGMNGIQSVITIKRYNGEELISEQIVASNVKKSSINKVVEIGTGKRKKQL